MQFTYSSYISLLSLLKSNNYQFSNYYQRSDTNNDKVVILRHDIDTEPKKALDFAKLEKQFGGVQSTYFVLLTSDLYNSFSKYNGKIFREIIENGHEIGIHFDEMAYPNIVGDPVRIREKIVMEADILSDIVGCRIKSFSYHRPSKKILDSQISIDGMVNSYSNVFFHDFKYLSDSRRNWREPVEKIIEGGNFNKLHILTHAFWYEENEKNIHDAMKNFICRANADRYHFLEENITDLKSVVSLKEVE